jgi:hypothetical protein
MKGSGNAVDDIGQIVTSVASAICVLLGLRLIRRDRGQAYAWFERAVLINLLLTQVFVLANDQFSALPAIALDLLMLGVLGAARGAIERDDALRRIQANESHVPADGVQKAYAD